MEEGLRYHYLTLGGNDIDRNGQPTMFKVDGLSVSVGGQLNALAKEINPIRKELQSIKEQLRLISQSIVERNQHKSGGTPVSGPGRPQLNNSLSSSSMSAFNKPSKTGSVLPSGGNARGPLKPR